MKTTDLPQDKKIILFDGICNLCDSMVQYVIGHDKKDIFRFVALQSELGIEILKQLNVDPKKTDSIVLYEPGKAHYYKSSAALEIGKYLGWNTTATILKIIPKLLRDPIYDYVAANRYKWYGKKESCMIPTQALKAKFL